MRRSNSAAHGRGWHVAIAAVVLLGSAGWVRPVNAGDTLGVGRITGLVIAPHISTTVYATTG